MVPAQLKAQAAVGIKGKGCALQHLPSGNAMTVSYTHLLPRLKERRNQPAGTLSGGEQQMLAVGRAQMCIRDRLYTIPAVLKIALPGKAAPARRIFCELLAVAAAMIVVLLFYI